MKGDSIDVKEDKVVPDWKQRLDYFLWLTMFYFYKCTHKHHLGWSNNNKCIQCVYMYTYGYVHGLLTISIKQSKCTYMYKKL